MLSLVNMFTKLIALLTVVGATIYDLGGASSRSVFRAQICAGLIEIPPSYIVHKEKDRHWIDRLTHLQGEHWEPDVNLFQRCTHVSRGQITYNFERDKANLPLLLTIIGVEKLEPLDVPQEQVTGIMRELRSLDAADATLRVWEKYGNSTEGMAKFNPGYAVHEEPWRNLFRPPLTTNPHYGFIDFAVYKQLFIFFLPNACIPLTRDHEVNLIIARTNKWHPPYTVLGYDDTWAIAGDLFEAQTNCLPEEGTMGQIPSVSTPNLAYFSRLGGGLEDRPKNTWETKIFDPKKKYVSFVYGDGDNLSIALGQLAERIEEALVTCRHEDCSFIGWSVSPHLASFAPQPEAWLLRNIQKLGGDILLPPSGYLYAYPAMMPDEIQTEYAYLTWEAAQNMGTDLVITWDWFYNWGKIVGDYLPMFNGKPACLFSLSVPFVLPIPMLGFRRQTSFPKILKAYFPWYDFYNYKQRSAMFVANKISSSPIGSVGYIYIGLDTPISEILKLRDALEDNVELISPSQLCQI